MVIFMMNFLWIIIYLPFDILYFQISLGQILYIKLQLSNNFYIDIFFILGITWIEKDGEFGYSNWLHLGISVNHIFF